MIRFDAICWFPSWPSLTLLCIRDGGGGRGWPVELLWLNRRSGSETVHDHGDDLVYKALLTKPSNDLHPSGTENQTKIKNKKTIKKKWPDEALTPNQLYQVLVKKCRRSHLIKIPLPLCNQFLVKETNLSFWSRSEKLPLYRLKSLSARPFLKPFPAIQTWERASSFIW